MTNKQRIIDAQKDVCNGLSGAYHDGCAYCILYQDGHGTVEFLEDGPFTNIDTAIQAAREHAKVPGNFDELIIVSVELGKPVAIVAPIEPVKPPIGVIMIGK